MNRSAIILFRTNIAASIISFLVFSIRVWSRFFVIYKPGWDDAVAFLALGVLLAHSALDIESELTLHLIFDFNSCSTEIKYGTGVSIEKVSHQDVENFMGVRSEDENRSWYCADWSHRA